MIPARCPKCYSRYGLFPENHICPMPPKEKRGRKPKDLTGSVRRNRNPLDRETYLDEVKAPHGTRTCAKRGCTEPECKEARNAYMREWKAKRKAKAS